MKQWRVEVFNRSGFSDVHGKGVLEDIQEAIGYLPKSIQRKVSYGLRIPLSEVYGVVTFYSFFTMVPRGRHTLRCCLGTACYVRGIAEVLNRLRSKFNLNVGDTTEDRRFSLEAVRCIGACGMAPVLMVDEDTHGALTPDKALKILENYD